MQCKWMFTKHFTLSTPQRKCPVLWQQLQEWASLAAMARYIIIICSIGYLQIFRSGYFFHKSIATTNETTNYDFSLPSKTFQRHLETRAANV